MAVVKPYDTTKKEMISYKLEEILNLYAVHPLSYLLEDILNIKNQSGKERFDIPLTDIIHKAKSNSPSEKAKKLKQLIDELLVIAGDQPLGLILK